jgi:ATP-dependent DNA helicase PIF1
LSTYNLLHPAINFQNVDGVCRIVAEEINYDVERLQNFWDHGYTRANDQQKQVLNSVTSALAFGDGGLFFLDGPGGTGKTFVESLLLAHVRAQGHVALAVASSGIASILLEGGRTSHLRFKIPINIHSESICSISAQSNFAKLLQMAKLIVWDEAPAQHRHCFEAVDCTLKDLRKSSTWFGGITMIFAGWYLLLILTISLGDFRQCLPIVPRAPQAQIVAATLPFSAFWKDIRVLASANQMHPAEHARAEDFAKWLLNIGDRTAAGPDNPFQATIPPGMNPIVPRSDVLMWFGRAATNISGR